jgi:hypothetical protein
MLKKITHFNYVNFIIEIGIREILLFNAYNVTDTHNKQAKLVIVDKWIMGSNYKRENVLNQNIEE